MKKFSLLFLPIVFLLLAGRVLSASSVASHKIVIDPGHGGSDYGSTACTGLYEKDANLDIALRLRALLEADGAQVFMTRTTDTYLSNADRYNYANSVGGEALLSIHLNGSNNPAQDGTLGLWGKRNKDLVFTKALHSSLASELGVPDLGTTNFASGVLLKSNMPASIQESVFISNSSECVQLTDGTGNRQQQIATSLYHGLISWFSTPH